MAKLNPLSFAKSIANRKDAKDKELINQLIVETETLQRRIDTQEDEFRRTNETLRKELYSLMDENSKLKQHKIDKQSSSDDQVASNLTENSNSPADSSSNHINDQSDCSDSCKANNRSLSITYSDLVGKEALENELDELRQKVKQLDCEKSNAVDKLQEVLPEVSALKQKVDDISKECDEKKSIIKEMREHMDEMKEQHSKEIECLKKEYESQAKLLKSKLDSLKSAKDDLVAAKQQIEGLVAEKSDLEEQLQKTRSLLEESYGELRSTKNDYEAKISDLKRELEAKIELVKVTSKDEIEKWQLKHLDASEEVESLQKQVLILNQKLSDGLEERKIHEKKGMLLVKEIKKQLAAEKKRADKLQSKLQELLSETSLDASGFNSTSASGDKNLNDSASTSSWSFINSKSEPFASNSSSAANARRPSSLHSFSDPGKDSSPTPVSPSTTTATDDLDVVSLVDDNAQLIAKVAELQQEKWRMDERVNHLQVDLDRIAKESQEKSKIIEFYCMEGRSDHASGHSVHNSVDKLTVKRVVDFIKDRGDESQKEINRKLQRLLEETLTKNMYLQKDLESMSNELVKLQSERQLTKESNTC